MNSNSESKVAFQKTANEFQVSFTKIDRQHVGQVDHAHWSPVPHSGVR